MDAKLRQVFFLSIIAILFYGCSTTQPQSTVAPKRPPASCRVNQDMFTFTTISSTGGYNIAGLPGCVTGSYPMKVVVTNKTSEDKWENLVNEDGSFSVIVKASEGDKIRYAFVDSSGRRANVTVRIPVMVKGSLLGGAPKTVDRFGETPGGPQALLAKALEQSGPAFPESQTAASGERVGRNMPLSQLKKIVAVAKFENRANFQSNIELGAAMQNQLIFALNNSGRFIVREQELLRDVFSEQDLAQSGRISESDTARIGKVLAAQYLVRGAVTEFEASEGSSMQAVSVYGISQAKSKQTSHMAVIIDLIDTTSGAVIISKRVVGKAQTIGKAGMVPLPYVAYMHSSQAKTPVNEAMQDCISNAVLFISEELDKRPWESRIAYTNENNDIYIIRGGAAEGMKVGYEFNVYHPIMDIFDKATGEFLDTKVEQAGRLKITEVKDKISYAQSITDDDFDPGDIIRIE